MPKIEVPDALKKRKRADVTKHCADAFQHRAGEYIHGKIDEEGQDNVGVQAAHEMERAAEAGVRQTVQTIQKSKSTKARAGQPTKKSKYRNTPQAKAKTAKYTQHKAQAARNATKSKATPSKLFQKRRLKRQMIYAKKAGAKATTTTTKVTAVKTKGLLGTAKALLVKAALALKAVGAKVLLLLLKIAIPVIIVIAIVALLLVIIGGIGQVAESSLSVGADGEAITAATRHMSYLDTRFPRNNDEAFALVAYLTATHGDFTFAEVLPVLHELHNASRGSTVRAAINARLTPEIQEFFDVLMHIRGGAQFLDSPFSFPWLPNVTSHFGYRIHPIQGGKRLHGGLDIALPTGTPIRATHDGIVTVSGSAGGFGLLVQIQGEIDGRTIMTRHAHNSRNLVRVGQAVTAGQIIAEVGSTGNSTGPHLHFEIWMDGAMLNPLFFIHTGEPHLFNREDLS